MKKLFFIMFLILISFLFGRSTTPQPDDIDNKQISVSICDEIISKVENSTIEIFLGKPATVNFDSFPEAKLFRTTIMHQSADGPNFAGHYTVVNWGCGTECQGFAIVDAISGGIVIYEPSIDHQVSKGLSFNLNSNLLVLNPKSDNQRYLDSIKGNSVSEMVANDYEAHKARIYYQLIEKNDEVYLHELCVENILDGQF
jgi:hypothetical protein